MELPKYFRDGVHFSIVEVEMLIGAICKEHRSIKYADRFIHSRITEYEIGFRDKKLNDFDMEYYEHWKEVAHYFRIYKLSFEREFYKKKAWQ